MNKDKNKADVGIRNGTEKKKIIEHNINNIKTKVWNIKCHEKIIKIKMILYDYRTSLLVHPANLKKNQKDEILM